MILLCVHFQRLLVFFLLLAVACAFVVNADDRLSAAVHTRAGAIVLVPHVPCWQAIKLVYPAQIALAALCVAVRGTEGAATPLDTPMPPSLEDIVKVFVSGQLRHVLAAATVTTTPTSGKSTGSAPGNVLDAIAGAEALILQGITSR